MTKDQILERLLNYRCVGIIRMTDGKRVGDVFDALCRGGLRCIEITLTTPGTLDTLRSLRANLPEDMILGAGTVLDAASVDKVVAAGAQFCVSPTFDVGMVRACAAAGVPSLPGCGTATEIYSAWNAGADLVKLFPSSHLVPQYIRDIHGPFPEIRLIPTGVQIDKAGEWLAAGAAAVGAGAALLDQAAIAEGRYDVIAERASRFVAAVSEAPRV